MELHLEAWIWREALQAGAWPSPLSLGLPYRPRGFPPHLPFVHPASLVAPLGLGTQTNDLRRRSHPPLPRPAGNPPRKSRPSTELMPQSPGMGCSSLELRPLPTLPRCVCGSPALGKLHTDYAAVWFQIMICASVDQVLNLSVPFICEKGVAVIPAVTVVRIK